MIGLDFGAHCSLTLLKTQSMIVNRSRILLNGAVLNVIDFSKILGVTLDKKLTFEKHVRHTGSSVFPKSWYLVETFSNVLR